MDLVLKQADPCAKKTGTPDGAILKRENKHNTPPRGSGLPSQEKGKGSGQGLTQLMGHAIGCRFSTVSPALAINKQDFIFCIFIDIPRLI
jgi:hypothetical protein